MEPSDKLFSFDGRIRRTEWWVRSILTGLIGAIVIAALRLISTQENGPFQGDAGAYAYLAVEVLVLLPFVWVQMALNVKRGHDLDFPAWPFVAFGALDAVIGYIPFYLIFSPAGPVTPANAALAANVVSWSGSLALLVTLGLFPGKPGPNRFGPSPYPEKPVFTAPGGVE